MHILHLLKTKTDCLIKPPTPLALAMSSMSKQILPYLIANIQGNIDNDDSLYLAQNTADGVLQTFIQHKGTNRPIIQAIHIMPAQYTDNII